MGAEKELPWEFMEEPIDPGILLHEEFWSEALAAASLCAE